MSLESLSSLRQLIQVEQQGESAQKDNLDKVQQAVQQQGTNEAQRVDNVHLEKAKAEYDKDIQVAHIQTIEAKLQREQMALTVSGIVAVGVTAFSVGDAAMSFMKDMGMGNLSLTGNKDQSGIKLGDGKQSDKVRDIDTGTGRHVEVGKSGTSASDHYLIGDNSDGSQTVQRAQKNSNGSFNTDIRSATISENDISDFLSVKKGGKNDFALVDADGKATNRAKLLGLADKDGKFTEEAEKLGLGAKGKDFNIKGIKSFDDLMKLDGLDPNNIASEALFNKKSHSILKSEVNGFMNMVEKTGAMDGGLVNDALKASGKTSNITFSDVMKSGANELIRAAETSIPFLQAYLQMKERVTQTAIELEAAKEKLAAALRKIKELEQLIITSGAGNNTENVAAPAAL